VPEVKSAVETISPTRVKLSVEVPFAELKPMLDDAYRTIGAQVQIPGFRKGKVPSRIIDQRVGRGAVVQEAVNEALPRFFAEAAEEQNVRAIGQPEVDVTAVPLEDGQDFTFTVETDVRPEVELPDLEGIAVEVDVVEATEDDITERLTALQERFGASSVSSGPSRTATSSPSTCRRRSAARRSTPSPVSPTRSAAATCCPAWTRPSSA
jgi:trigger factor